MKLLFEDHDQRHWHSFYLCDTIEEYDDKLAQCKADAIASTINDPWQEGKTLQLRPVNEEVITCSPSTIVMDGYASYGGRKFKAEGFAHHIQQGWLGNGYNVIKFYIKPGTITTDETVKTKDWWV